MDSELYEIGSDFIPDINNYENVSVSHHVCGFLFFHWFCQSL